MKKFYFLTLALICAFVANAADGKPAHMYFDGTGWVKPNVQFMIGHSTYSIGYKMTKINRTNLYYVKTPNWGGYSEFAIFGNDAEWGKEDHSITHRSQYSAEKTAIFNASNYTLNENDSYLFTDKKTSADISWLGNGYNSLNHTQTINIDGVGSVAVSSAKLSSVSATVATSVTATVDTENATSTASTSIDAAYTATVTCVATPGEGESFMGWYDENEQELSNQETYTYNAANADKTITAKFSKTTAIEEVGVDAGAAVYYNLQGVKVANPENGIFIKKQGNKTTKVVL